MSDDDIKRPLQDDGDNLSGGNRTASDNSKSSNQLTTRQYFLVNLSKFVVEMLGTCVLGSFYILMGDQQTGMLLGMWVIILFAEAISGAYFNPCITMVFMLRKGEGKLGKAGKERLKGLFYIAAQFAGGILAGLLSYVLSDASLELTPMIFFDVVEDKPLDSKWKFKVFESWVSETIGTFVFVFLFMICTDKATQFSQDKVINCFIMAASYVAARLISGGKLVTALVDNSHRSQTSNYTAEEIAAATEEEKKDFNEKAAVWKNSWACITAGGTGPLCELDGAKTQLIHKVGPLLNPAIAFGQMLTKWNFADIQYFLCPFFGAILALIFYEFVFVRSQEYLKEGSSDSNEKFDGSEHSANEPIGEINDAPIEPIDDSGVRTNTGD